MTQPFNTYFVEKTDKSAQVQHIYSVRVLLLFKVSFAFTSNRWSFIFIFLSNSSNSNIYLDVVRE